MKPSSPEDQTLEYYNLNADAYVARTHSRLDRDALEQFSKLIPKSGKLLDAGCGSGRDLGYFAQSGFSSEGFDGSPQMVSRAQQSLLGTHTPVWQSDFRFLNLKRENYDAIWAMESLIHLPPVVCLRVVQTFFSAVKSGGILFASFEESETSSHREDHTDNPNGPSRHIYSYPHSEFESLLRQSGFQPLFSGKSMDEVKSMAVIARRI
jgi:2-polyprenyl-3-methyl-5-hydroxy-6-metoxy-1,4-benzoquinol methylase